MSCLLVSETIFLIIVLLSPKEINGHGAVGNNNVSLSCVGPPNFHGKSGLINKQYRWPNKTIVYKFEDNYPDHLKQVFQEAIHHVSSRTCMKFRPRTDEEDYVLVISGNGCYAAARRVKDEQLMSLPAHCPTVHEVLYSVGFYHEHQRPDRDHFVNIHWENIKPEFKFAFRKLREDYVSTFDVPYDYGSVLHYPRKAFSVNEKDTITPKEPGVELGQLDGMSPYDELKVNRMYEC